MKSSSQLGLSFPQFPDPNMVDINVNSSSLRTASLDLVSAWSTIFHLTSSGMLVMEFLTTWQSCPHCQHTPSCSFKFTQLNSDFSPWPFFVPPPQLFMYNADSARLSSGCSTLTIGPGAATSVLFTSNCLSAKVISSMLGFLNSCEVWVWYEQVPKTCATQLKACW